MDKTPAEIIDRRGGPSAFAERIGRTSGAVRVWKHRGTFPREAWPEIMQAYAELTLDVMMRLEREGAAQPQGADIAEMPAGAGA